MEILHEDPTQPFREALRRLEEKEKIAPLSEEERKEYEYNLKAYRDWYSVIKTAQVKARKEGHADIVRTMAANGCSPDAVARLTNLPLAEVEALLQTPPSQN